MVNYAYDTLRREFWGTLKEKGEPSDQDRILAFLDKYRLTSHSKPSAQTVYQWYRQKFNMTITDVIAMAKEEAKPKAEDKQATLLKVEEPKTEIPVASEAVIEGAAPKGDEDEELEDEDAAEDENKIASESKTVGREEMLADIPKEQHVSETEGVLKTTGKKIKVQLGKVGFIIADTEAWIYRRARWRELSADERAETTSAVADIIDNRVTFASTYGDAVNLLIVVGSHFSSRVIETKVTAPQQGRYDPNDPFAGSKPPMIDQKTGQVSYQ